MNRKTMTGRDAVELLTLFEQNKIEVWVDGGWGVDALLGYQTRSHDDLDIALCHNDVPKLRELLEARGYTDVPRNDTRDCNFVLGDEYGREVDVHSFVFDEQGKVIFGVPYPADSLTGTGAIEGLAIRCISVEWMVKFHAGYTLDDNDYRDVLALCQRFDILLPEEYKSWVTKDTID